MSGSSDCESEARRSSVARMAARVTVCEAQASVLEVSLKARTEIAPALPSHEIRLPQLPREPRNS